MANINTYLEATLSNLHVEGADMPSTLFSRVVEIYDRVKVIPKQPMFKGYQVGVQDNLRGGVQITLKHPGDTDRVWVACTMEEIDPSKGGPAVFVFEKNCVPMIEDGTFKEHTKTKGKRHIAHKTR